MKHCKFFLVTLITAITILLLPVHPILAQSTHSTFSPHLTDNIHLKEAAENQNEQETKNQTFELYDLLTSVIDDGLPEDIEAGDPHFENVGGINSFFFKLFWKDSHIFIGEMSVWKYAGIQLDEYQATSQRAYKQFPDAGVPFITGGETFGDRSVTFKSGDHHPDGVMIVQLFQKDDTFADVSVFETVPQALSIVWQIAGLIEEHIQPPQITVLHADGDSLEQQYVSCFPESGDLGFDHPFAQYAYYTDMKTEGIVYSTRYTDFLDAVLYVHVEEFVLRPTGQDLPRYNKDYMAEVMEDLYPDELGTRSEALSIHNLYHIPKNYDHYVHFLKGNTLVTLEFSELEYDPQTLANMISIAKKMEQCLPENAEITTAISVPEDENKSLLNKGMIEIEGFNTFDGNTDPLQDGLPLLAIPANIRMFIPQQLSGPLTIAIYNPERGIYTYKKQEKDIPPVGDYFSIIRTEMYSTFIKGKNELHIWSGDNLILIYPFALSRDYGARG